MSLESLTFDETSLFLLLIGFGIILYRQWYTYLPDIHHSFVNTQALSSPTRFKNETSIYRHRATPFTSDLTRVLSRDVATCRQLVSTILKRSSDLVGYTPVRNGSEVAWLNGSDMELLIKRFVSGLLSSLTETQSQVTVDEGGDKFVVLCEETSLDLLIVMLAGMLFGYKMDFVLPTITNSQKLLSNLINGLLPSQRTVIFCSQSQLDLLTPVLRNTSPISRVLAVVLDAVPQKASPVSENTTIKYFGELFSSANSQQTFPTPKGSNEMLFQFWSLNNDNSIQTVGFFDSQVVASVAGISKSFPAQFRLSERDLYYSPRSITSTSEFSTILYMFYMGIPVGLGSSIELFQPTVAFAPTLEVLDLLQSWGLGVGAEKIGEELIGSAYESPPPMGSIKRWFLHFQLCTLKQYRHLSNNFFSSLIFKSERAFFGGRVRLLFVSNPYLPIAHRNALQVILGSQIVTTFALSPYSSGASCASFGWAVVGTYFDYNPNPELPLIGGPSPSLEFKLSLVSEDKLSDGEDPVGRIWVSGNNVSSFTNSGDELSNHSNHWIPTNLMGRVNPASSLAILTTRQMEPLAVSPAWVGLHWLETWVSAHDSYIHRLRLELIPSSSPSLPRFGGLVVLRIDPVLIFAKNRDITPDLEQLLASPRLRAHVLQSIQAELAAAASPEREYSEGISPGMPGPLPKIELVASHFKMVLQSNINNVDDPEMWE